MTNEVRSTRSYSALGSLAALHEAVAFLFALVGSLAVVFASNDPSIPALGAILLVGVILLIALLIYAFAELLRVAQSVGRAAEAYLAARGRPSAVADPVPMADAEDLGGTVADDGEPDAPSTLFNVLATVFFLAVMAGLVAMYFSGFGA